ncbi:UDP-glucose/GDP-mannose dehydrogenase family protein [Salinibacterium sp. SYSU T00001]|uniref:UDP-glucose dehydrogenase family protein n=1 Tax=Homoserinimonas sedimenticola TaxID=2986805 RepID=UPI002235BDAF|nr:UDP-glucose/GDP-mannose dehydrogenase family protein [Salinibacterium sedimenticola]MCW4385088.1 UDP-glucose/GDP-mannose dehydrogenase family protein [Salinibacterium sedimenticola]
MKISVIGCGYLGAVHAACMAELGHEVIGIDVDEHKIELLAEGKPPFYEPGLPELLTTATASGRLHFSTDASNIASARVHFIAVGTPQLADSNGADLTYVDAAIESLLPHLQPGDLVVGKSTVPVGTAARLYERIREAAPGASLAWNPEFLREGFAVKDTIAPDRIVYGLAPGDDTAEELLDEIYATALEKGSPKVVTDFATAELVKVSANAFLATKISFINAMAEVAEATGADVTALADAIGHDTRIGRRFLNAGLGFGGGCLPKDIRAFMARAEELGVDQALSFLQEVDSINMRRRERMVDLTREVVGGDLQGKRIAVLGLAFKPDSDDVRDSPALDVVIRLAELGADVVATDPQALDTARRRKPDLAVALTAAQAAENADAVLVLTEWREYRELDPAQIASVVRTPAIVDGRNCLDPVQWRGAGWHYRALGRP